jgi:epsilon-lactone hydrolase
MGLGTVGPDDRQGPKTRSGATSADIAKRFLLRKEVIMGHDVFTLNPKGRAAQRQILYLHGGGFVLSITEPHWEFIARMAGFVKQH